MLLVPTAAATGRAMPPGFIDFTSSSFGAIFPAAPPRTSSTTDSVQQRVTHLPDLLPFIQLITEKCHVEPVHLVMALMYVQRFRSALPAGYKAEPEAAHRIFVASLLVASKFVDDHCLSTRQVVRATGDVWSIKDMTRMELAFLRFLHWDLYIHPDEMAVFLRDLNFDMTLLC